jgi:hypothetical protein
MTIRGISDQLTAGGGEMVHQTIHRWLTEEAAAGSGRERLLRPVEVGMRPAVGRAPGIMTVLRRGRAGVVAAADGSADLAGVGFQSPGRGLAAWRPDGRRGGCG